MAIIYLLAVVFLVLIALVVFLSTLKSFAQGVKHGVSKLADSDSWQSSGMTMFTVGVVLWAIVFGLWLLFGDQLLL